jgi:ribosome biogenesis SPOUT family RNA methylase Rps3
VKLTNWLMKQVAKLEREIRETSIFDNASPASRQELADLRRKVVIRDFLAQELERRRADELEPWMTGAYAAVPIVASRCE